MPAILILICLSAFLPWSYGVSTASGNDVMAVAAFVDIYRPNGEYRFVSIPTSDGGLAFGVASTYGYIRLVKLNSTAGFVWAGLASPLSSEGNFYPVRTVVEDLTGAYFYVAGGVNTMNCVFVVKFSAKDGSLINSHIGTVGTSDAYVTSLLVESGGALIFTGYYYDTDMYYPWSGLVDKSTLRFYDRSILAPVGEQSKLLKIVEDGDTLVFLGTLGNTNYLWLGGVKKPEWTKLWDLYLPDSTGKLNGFQLLRLSSGNYAALFNETYYQFTSASAFTAVIPFPGAKSMSLASNGTLIMIVGFSLSEVTYQSVSFAYTFDYVSQTVYNQSTMGEYNYTEFVYAVKHQSYDGVWVSAVDVSDRVIVAKLSIVTPLVCSSGEVNYFNRGCYPILTSGCYGLCSTCLAANDPNACVSSVSRTYVTSTYALSFYAGRCFSINKHYTSAVKSCSKPILESCHPLCGGDCMVASDATECGPHCDMLDPYIDDSEIASNVCKCRSGTSLSVTGLRCVISTACHPLCGNNECVYSNDSTSCLSCVEHAVAVASFHRTVQCVCESGTLFNGTACTVLNTSSCHPLCKSGCTVPNDSYHCADCRLGRNVVFELYDTYYAHCSCASGTEIVNNTCGYTYGCDSHCVGCIVPANISACIGCAVGITPNYSSDLNATCKCPSNTAYYNSSCIAVIADSASCSNLCADECLLAHNSLMCVGSCANLTGATAVQRTGDTVECGCQTEMKLSTTRDACVQDLNCGSLCEVCADSSVCSICPTDQDGVVLSEGKCVCSVDAGYVMLIVDPVANLATCIQRENEVSKAALYSGASVVSAVALAAALLPGSGYPFWKYLTAAQELVLLAVVNSRFGFAALVRTFQGCGFVNVGALRPIVGWMFAGISEDAGLVVLPDSAMYHPAIQGSTFAPNVGPYLLFTIISMAGYAGCLLLGEFFSYFRKLREAFWLGGVVSVVQTCYIDVLLVGFIQLRYFSVGHCWDWFAPEK